VNLRSCAGWIVLAALVGTSGLNSAPIPEKVVHLRAETIRTPAKVPGRAQARAASGSVSGLYLIQFEGPFQSAWEEALRGQGVVLLNYVPDDAFVVRLHRASLDAIESLEFVRWAGKYRPDHKSDKSFRTKVKRAKPTEEVPVSLLLASDSGPAEIAAVRGFLREVKQESRSRFGVILRGSMVPGRLDALAQSPSVLWVEPMARMKLFDEVASKIVGGAGPGHATLTQSLGYDGTGVTVAVADSGLNNGDKETMHPDLFGRVDAFFYYGNLEDASDEHSHGTHVTGIIAGNGAVGETDENNALYGLGVAPGAHIVAQRIFDGVGNFKEPPTYETLTRNAVQAGAVVGSNSWGDDTQGRYDTFAMEFDALVRDADGQTDGDQPYILEFSAGNAGPGPQTVGTPAVAKNVIATGASENDRLDFFLYADGPETMADFSSRGPAEDGRIKPDLVAPGTWIASLQSESATDENAWLPISPYYQYQGGTSQAGPHVSGAAAVFVQYYRQVHGGETPSPALVKAALINSATDMDDSVETGPVPNMDEGWGRLDLTPIVGGTRAYEFVDQTNLLVTGQTYEERVILADANEPLKVTLAYTDVPGFVGAIPALVNDLDLEVVGPDGRIYRGNQFEDGESVPDAPSYDTINNVEAVHLAEPLPGEYLVRVHATRVTMDARRDTSGAIDQDFALVASGSIPPPGVGIVFFDRRAYRAPDQMRIRVVDRDLAGQASVNVQLRSTTESSGETISLAAVNAFGSFSATVAIVTGSPVPDGQLQVAHGDTLEAFYEDESAATTRTATARADLLPPVLSDPAAVDSFGRTLIEWQSDEPANSVVRYGTGGVLSLAATNRTLTTDHAVRLLDVLPDVTYSYVIISRDEAGNVSTNDNHGAMFTFVPSTPPRVLLVDSYVDELFSVPPLSGYTDALDAAGISYDVWDATQEGSPSLIDLQPFRAVIWRVQEFLFGLSPFSPDEQTAISNYLNGGGSLFVASMEAPSRLEEGMYDAFRTNVLKVAAFEPDVGVPEVEGVTGDPIAAGIDVILDYSPYDDSFKYYLDIPSDVSDTISPAETAAPLFLNTASGEVTGLRFPTVGVDSPGRVVYLSFPLDAVPLNGAFPNNRAEMLRRIVDFLAPPSGFASIALNRSEYTLPSQVTVEVTDLDQTGRGPITIRCFSGSHPEGLDITAGETVRSGLFRGFVTLADSTNAGPADLPTANGETIRFDYGNTSEGSTVISASALVETVLPVISNLTAAPDYVEAVITWDTSEPTDGLVQYGESLQFPVNRTSYDGKYSLSHELILTGLQPDQSYYYQVVSQDRAGNVAVDNNTNQFHTFKTLKPLDAPWSDDMESGATNWEAMDIDLGSGDTGWQWGVPENGFGVSAHSPVNAWGSNLKGNAIGFLDSQLISPPTYLHGGSQATLHFWHNYDFSLADVAEVGVVSIATNSLVEPEILTVVGDPESSDGWQEVTIDLTPYMGKTVFLVWEYGIISVTDVRTLGWLVDDVSITISGMPGGGTIVITNNLAQATWNLSGPINQSGQGISTAIPGAPPGQYTVTFGDVPFYQTAPPQSGPLAEYGSLQLAGQYTLVDDNGNGMSDAWEQLNFNEVSPSRTGVTDTDLDGFPDLAEFVAGTDPNQTDSKLTLTAPIQSGGGGMVLEWASVPGRIYRVSGSTDAMHWAPVSDWIPATAATTSFTLPASGPGVPFLFRLEVRP
jgi:subtilisin family serine protease